MNFALLRKTINDGRWLLAACTGLVFAFSWIRVVIVSNLEMYQIQRITHNLPDMIKRLSPVPLEKLTTFAGLIGYTFEEPVTYLMMAAWAFARGSDCVSGELERGTLEMLLAQPVSRRRYLGTHVLVTLLGVLVIALATQFGTYAGVHTTTVKRPLSPSAWAILLQATGGEALKHQEARFERVPMVEFVDTHLFWIATVNLACLGVFLAASATVMSSWDRYRWRTLGIVVGFYVIETIIELSSKAIEDARWLRYLTYFSAYEPVAFVVDAAQQPATGWRFWASRSHGAVPDLGPLGCDALLLGLAGVGYAVAFYLFRRRDLPAPL